MATEALDKGNRGAFDTAHPGERVWINRSNERHTALGDPRAWPPASGPLLTWGGAPRRGRRSPRCSRR